MKYKYRVSKTFSRTTSESAEHGDFSETGFVFNETVMSFDEVSDEINELGYFDHSWYKCDADLYESDWSTIDYSTNEQEQQCLHIRGSIKAMAALKVAFGPKEKPLPVKPEFNGLRLVWSQAS